MSGRKWLGEGATMGHLSSAYSGVRSRAAPPWLPRRHCPPFSRPMPAARRHRTTHPTQAIRLRKQFKVQQARITLESRNGKKSSKAHPASFTATGTTHRVAHRPLCQPVHSLRDAKRGIGGSKQASSSGGQEDDQDVRRGRRARRQVHPSLSEEMMATANGSVESDDGDDCADEEDDMCGGGSGAGLCGEAPLRFRKSEDAPWGKGDKPLIKVSRGDRGLGPSLDAINLI